MTEYAAEGKDTAAPSHGVRWGVVALSFAAVLLDGFDTSALGIAVPSVAKEWGMDPAAFTVPLALTNAGVVVGYLASGSLCARFGQRRVLLSGVLLFAASTLLTAVVVPWESPSALTAARFISGLGLGAVLPAAVSLAAAHSAERRRELVSVLVTLGLASGATVGGFVGGELIQRLGVDGMFWLAGGLPLVVALLMVRVVPTAAPSGQGTAEPADSRVSQLLAAGTRVSTVLIWLFSFLVFLATYTLQAWLPTALGDFGFSPTEAPLGTAWSSIGGVVGGVVLMTLAGRIGIAPALVILPTIGAAACLTAATADLGKSALLLVLGVAGAGITAGMIGQLALAVSLYPAATRTTGIGWAAAFGRLGSIVGPSAAGILLAFAVSGRGLLIATAVPVLAAVLCAAALWTSRTSRTTPAPQRTGTVTAADQPNL
ncbi:MFS transporter [Streptomyces iconiensis]|uniref:MFS transporter n=1 Tax=Streptomyces iconiensis TaxID=1384038 RepID=A0ABT6ZQD8_9ACTN|nr:MFS transporter [Streptomyces iconiensis]MDJ1131267.1 MFS transporter [Streptomyces iconiensis]